MDQTRKVRVHHAGPLIPVARQARTGHQIPVAPTNGIKIAPQKAVAQAQKAHAHLGHSIPVGLPVVPQAQAARPIPVDRINGIRIVAHKAAREGKAQPQVAPSIQVAHPAPVAPQALAALQIPRKEKFQASPFAPIPTGRLDNFAARRQTHSS
jgi:hypothetical protein